MELHWQSLRNNYIVKATVIHANRQGYMGMQFVRYSKPFTDLVSAGMPLVMHKIQDIGLCIQPIEYKRSPDQGFSVLFVQPGQEIWSSIKLNFRHSTFSIKAYGTDWTKSSERIMHSVIRKDEKTEK